ncbi:MAG: hypothetical protein ACT4QD_25795 [Acidobacteriota bacterium]
MAIERSSSFERDVPCALADEIAIDFPAVSEKVDRMRDAFLEQEHGNQSLLAEIRLSRRQAGTGAAIPLDVPVRSTCRGCGGRGEVWGEACGACAGSGDACHTQKLTVSVPPGVAHGARFKFSVARLRGPRTHVEVRIALT